MSPIQLALQSSTWQYEAISGGGGGSLAKTLTEKSSDETLTNITAIGDNLAIINLADLTNVSTLIVEYLVKVLGAANALIEINFDIHDPSHNILNSELIVIRFAITGTGDIFGVVDTIRVKDTIPEIGNYHINVTVLTLNAGIFKVLARRLIGIST